MVKLIKPSDLNEALEILSTQKMVIFAGGTDLMITHRARAGTLPDFKDDVLYVADLNELKTIKVDKDAVMIGAGVTMSEILNHPDVPDYVKAPCAQVGSLAIRNKATLGGNIVNASPAGDTLGMLVALDAQVVCRSKQRGKWLVPIESFILGPKKTGLKQDEILIGVMIPRLEITEFTFRKVGSRQANAITKLSFYGAVVTQDHHCVDVRIAFGAMGPTIIRNREAELALINSEERMGINQIQALYERYLIPIDDLRSTKNYRKQVALNLLSDFIEKELIR